MYIICFSYFHCFVYVCMSFGWVISMIYFNGFLKGAFYMWVVGVGDRWRTVLPLMRKSKYLNV